MTIPDMKSYCVEHSTSRFFTDDNVKHWNIKFEDEPNEYNIFIYSANSMYDWEPKDMQGRTYCVRIFCTELGRPEGIVYKGRNFASFKDANHFKYLLTDYLKNNINSTNSITKIIQKHDLIFNNLAEFYFENGEVITIDLDNF